jgi:hypothetical protein
MYVGVYIAIITGKLGGLLKARITARHGDLYSHYNRQALRAVYTHYNWQALKPQCNPYNR